MEEITIRDAEIDDAKIILNFVRELAKYEKAETQVVATENDIRNTIFGPDSTADRMDRVQACGQIAC